MDALIAKLDRDLLSAESDDDDLSPNGIDWSTLRNLKNGCNRSRDVMLKKLDGLRAPPEITRLAREIYFASLEPDEEKRYKVRTSLLCAAVYMAYASTNTNLDREPLLAYFSVKVKRFTDALKAMKMRLESVRDQSEADYNDVFVLCTKLNLSEDFETIKAFVANNSEGTATATRLAMVYAWMVLNKKRVPDISAFSKACGLSEASVKRGISSVRGFVDPFIERKRLEMVNDFENEISRRFSVTAAALKKKPKMRRLASLNTLFS